MHLLSWTENKSTHTESVHIREASYWIVCHAATTFLASHTGSYGPIFREHAFDVGDYDRESYSILGVAIGRYEFLSNDRLEEFQGADRRLILACKKYAGARQLVGFLVWRAIKLVEFAGDTLLQIRMDTPARILQQIDTAHFYEQVGGLYGPAKPLHQFLQHWREVLGTTTETGILMQHFWNT